MLTYEDLILLLFYFHAKEECHLPKFTHLKNILHFPFESVNLLHTTTYHKQIINIKGYHKYFITNLPKIESKFTFAMFGWGFDEGFGKENGKDR